MKKIISKIKEMNLGKFLVPIIIILIVLAVAQGVYSNIGISSKKASEIAINYINGVLQGQATVSVIKTTKQSGVYKLDLKIGDKEMVSYISKDGKILFPEGVEIKAEDANKAEAVNKKDKAEVKLFVMSFCPYGNQAEEAMAPVVDLLKDKADIQLHYVIYNNYNGGGPNYCLDKENKYCSMHGIHELNQDVRELCVQKYQQDKFWNFVKQIDAACGVANVDICWEGVAQKNGIDIDKIKTCEKDEAISLLSQEVELNQKYNISGSPQLIINDKESQPDRTPEGFKTAVCAGFNSAPSECSQKLESGTGASSSSGGCH